MVGGRAPVLGGGRPDRPQAQSARTVQCQVATADGNTQATRVRAIGVSPPCPTTNRRPRTTCQLRAHQSGPVSCPWRPARGGTTQGCPTVRMRLRDSSEASEANVTGCGTSKRCRNLPLARSSLRADARLTELNAARRTGELTEAFAIPNDVQRSAQRRVARHVGPA